jgi:hypothetical protein
MYNGFRGFRGWAYPFRYPGDDMTLGYVEALALSNSDYFNPDRPVNSTTSPAITSFPGGSVPLANGLLPIKFSAVDPLGLAAAVLTHNGDIVGAIALSGTHFTGTITTPYFTKNKQDTFGLLVYDQNGNRTDASALLTPSAPTGTDAAPQPFVRLSTSTIGAGQSVVLDASRSNDPDDAIATVEWDLGDGNFTAPSGSKVRVVSFSQPGTHLIRARLTDASGNQSISNPLALRVLPPGPTVSSFVVNDGSAQRSAVSSLTITFDQPVTLGSNVMQLLRTGGGVAPTLNVSNPSSDGRTYVLTFSGDGSTNGVPADGSYRIVITPSAVVAQSDFAQPMANTTPRVFGFYKLYGDANGDGDVDAADVALFRTTFGKSAGDAGFSPFFDFNGDGKIDAFDLQQLRSRLGARIVLGTAAQTASAIARARLQSMGATP